MDAYWSQAANIGEPDGRAWFPFSSLLFTEIQATARR